MRRQSLFQLIALLFAATAGVAGAQVETGIDTALAVAVDVSQSVDQERYALQIEGIARALEDPQVIAAITSGQRAAILFAMIAWSDTPVVVVPWEKIASAADASRVAAMVRAVPQKGGEFTCLARMLRNFSDTQLPTIPMPAARVVIDVSGDGIDNCNVRSTIDDERRRLVDAGVTINGLPIMVPGENDIVGAGAYRQPGFGLNEVGPGTDTTTLDAYFKEHVIGGPGAFILPANGYADFGRAIVRKFVTEVSSIDAGAVEAKLRAAEQAAGPLGSPPARQAPLVCSER